MRGALSQQPPVLLKRCTLLPPPLAGQLSPDAGVLVLTEPPPQRLLHDIQQQRVKLAQGVLLLCCGATVRPLAVWVTLFVRLVATQAE
jgi:hypothetical protein